MKALILLSLGIIFSITAPAQNTATDSLSKSIGDLVNNIRELKHPSPLPATLQLYNNTDKEIYAAYVIYDNDAQYWVSNGWYKIEAYSSKNIDLGKYAGSVYIHGMQHTYMGFGSDNIWGNDYSFCIDKENAFAIRNADKNSCSDKNRAKFSKLRISAGTNRWDFNP